MTEENNSAEDCPHARKYVENVGQNLFENLSGADVLKIIFHAFEVSLETKKFYSSFFTYSYVQAWNWSKFKHGWQTLKLFIRSLSKTKALTNKFRRIFASTVIIVSVGWPRVLGHPVQHTRSKKKAKKYCTYRKNGVSSRLGLI